MVTLEDVKNYLGISGTTHDSFLTLQIGIVSEAIEGYCRRSFSESNYVQTFYKEDYKEYQDQLSLYHFPLIGSPSVVEVDSNDSDIPVIDFRFHSPTAILTKASPGKFFTDGYKVEVTYTAGYATIPAPVLGVLYGIIQERYNKKVNGIDINFGSDVQRLSLPGVMSIDFDYSLASNDRKSPFGNILGNHLNVLDAYRSERTLLGSSKLSYVS